MAWRYYPADLTLNRVKFGFWTQSRGYVSPVMMMVNATFNRVIPGRYESRISWAGNLTSSLAKFILQHVQPEDDGAEFGIHLEFGFRHKPLLDSVKIKVVEKRM